MTNLQRARYCRDRLTKRMADAPAELLAEVRAARGCPEHSRPLPADPDRWDLSTVLIYSMAALMIAWALA